jgi:hypothetical protein
MRIRETTDRQTVELLDSVRLPAAKGQRPAQLYRFFAARFEKLKDKGILFPF